MQAISTLRLVPSGLVSIKALSLRYGVSKSSLYELVKSDPTFPCKNVGLKKKLMVDAAQFEAWLEARNKREHEVHFALPSASGLLEKYKR